MVPMGKILKKFKNVITLVVHKIESLFYGSRVWFSKMGNLTASFKFTFG